MSADGADGAAPSKSRASKLRSTFPLRHTTVTSVSTGKFILLGILGVLLAPIIWFMGSRYHHAGWGWPLALVFGASFVLCAAYLIRRTQGKPAPFQLVLRLANKKGGDTEDNKTFELLHERFERLFPKSSDIRFDGFDTDGSFIWFYFLGQDETSVSHAVLSQLQGCRIREGSYFLSNTNLRSKCYKSAGSEVLLLTKSTRWFVSF